METADGITARLLLGLATLCLAFASTAPHAAFPAPKIYWVIATSSFGDGNCTIPGGCAFASAAAACEAGANYGNSNYWNADQSDYPNGYENSFHEPYYHCLANYGPSCGVPSQPCTWGGSAVEKTSLAGVCPNNSTPNGANCVCKPGFQQFGSSCHPGDCAGGTCPSVGNPINPANGNKFERVAVYRGVNGFEFNLYYNSLEKLKGRYSRRWRDTFDRQIVMEGTDAISYRQDGKANKFSPSGGLWIADAATNDRLTQLSNPAGWQLQVADGDEIETYDGSGKLLTIKSRSGLTQTLTYTDGTANPPNGGYYLDSSSGNPTLYTLPAGLLLRVADNFGRTLSFKYDIKKPVQRVTDPAGNVYVFGYTWPSYMNLIWLYFPDAKYPQYSWNESANTSGANLPNALTGIIDENNSRTSTFKYSTNEWAISTERAGAVERYTITYNADGSAAVVDPLNSSRTYSFQNILNRQKLTGITGAVGPAYGPAVQTFDANGNPASKTDWNGNRTNFTYDLTRNLETQRVEGLTSAGGTTPQTRTISTEWHATFRLATRIAEPLRLTTYAYNGDGGASCGYKTDGTTLVPGIVCSKTIQVTTDADGSLGFGATLTGQPRTWTYTYNPNGFVLTVNGPRTDVTDQTSYAYYADNDADFGKRGNVSSITNAAGHVTNITAYNAHGQPLTIVDSNGLTTTLTYDLRRRLKTRNVGGEVTTYDYDFAGPLIKVTLPDGSFLRYCYDGAHRLTAMSDGAATNCSDGNRISYTLDAMANRTLEQVRDPKGVLAQTRSRVYSNLNRLFQEVGAVTGEVTEYGYDNQGNVTSAKDALNHITGNQYDYLNRLKQVTDPGTGVTLYGYNGLDALTSVTDPRTLVTTYSLDGLGNLVQQASPDTGTTVNTYDAAGNLAMQTDAKNQVTTYAYDALNRVTLVTFHNGWTQTYIYDQGSNGLGRLTSIEERNPSGNVVVLTQYVYNQKGRLTSDTRTVNSIAYATGYSYDSYGRLSGMTYPSGRTVAYSFDPQGRVNQITTTKVGGTQQTLVLSVQYHPFGAVKGYTLGNGQVYTRTVDQDGRIASYTLGTSTYNITFDKASRITGIAESGNPSNANTYGYDVLDRLTSATLPSATFGYTYDAVGNRQTKSIGAATDTYAYEASSNRLSSITPASGPVRNFSFDANGSTIDDGLNTYGYDTRGRMNDATSATGTTDYQVNALGQRVRKTNSQGDTVYLYDANGRLISESSAVGVLKREYLYLGDILVGVGLP